MKTKDERIGCCPMCSLQPGQSAKVESIGDCRGLESRLRQLGLREGDRVKCLCRSPLGDPAAYSIRGAVIALRGRDAAGVKVQWK